MLVLSRKVGERLVIGDSIVLTVLSIQGTTVKVGIAAPREVAVVRSELLSPAAPATPDSRQPSGLAGA